MKIFAWVPLSRTRCHKLVSDRISFTLYQKASDMIGYSITQHRIETRPHLSDTIGIYVYVRYKQICPKLQRGYGGVCILLQMLLPLLSNQRCQHFFLGKKSWIELSGIATDWRCQHWGNGQWEKCQCSSRWGRRREWKGLWKPNQNSLSSALKHKT